MVDNPPHHPRGDFGLSGGRLDDRASPRYTYSGIGVFRPAMFAPLPDGERPLRPVLDTAVRAGRVSGEHHAGAWMDIGSPERLEALDAALRGR
jgi:MurNAc alpha-1-phosphate uridylyltransferase